MHRSFRRFVRVIWFLLLCSAIYIRPLLAESLPQVSIAMSPEDSEMIMTVQLPIARVDRDAAGSDRIIIDGHNPVGKTGDPMLPGFTYELALPPNAMSESVQVRIASVEFADLPGVLSVSPAPPVATNIDGETGLIWGRNRANIVAGKNAAVYGVDAFYPPQPLVEKRVSTLRTWRVLQLVVVPVQYNPQTGRARSATSMELRISFERGLQPQSAKLDLVGREWAARRFQNYQQAQAWYPAMRSLGAAALPGAIYDYVIVTTNAIQSGSSKLDDFVAHKELKGLSVLVITEDEYAAVIGPAPNGTAEKIRKWLQDNYLSMQTRYVLLIGNPHPSSGDVPMKMCWPRLYATSYTSYKESPTDHYYADLTGNWDLNGDNYFGDYDNDQGVGGVDFTSELYVGRIPVYTSQAGWAATLDSILQKIIDYENDPAAAWRQSALLPMSFSDASTDGAVLAQEFRDDHLSPLGFSAWTMYQQGSGACGANSSYSSDQELRGGTGVRDRWAANDYGLVMWWGHGSTSGAYVGYGGCWDDDGTGNGQIMESSNAASLDDTHPSVVYLNSCLNGYPESTSNLGYALLKKGAIGTVSASRVSWYLVGPWFTSRFFADNAAIGYYFMADVASGTTLGEALFEQKSQMSWFFDNESWMNLMDFNLFGDPALSINPAAEEPTATPTPTLSATATATPTTTPTATSTSTATLTATATATGSATATPSATASATVTPTATWTFTSTPTPTITSTISPTASPTFTATQVATATPTRTASVTPSSVFTATPVFTLPSTATPSATPSSIPDGGEEELDPLQAGTYDDNHEGLIYEGDWVIRAGSKLYGGGEHVSSQRGNSVRFAFRGSRFSLRYASLAGRGTLRVFVNGSSAGRVLQQGSRTRWRRQWTSPSYEPGIHEVELVHSRSRQVGLDAISVRD